MIGNFITELDRKDYEHQEQLPNPTIIDTVVEADDGANEEG